MNPWIFRQAKHFLNSGELAEEPTLRERVDVLREHLRFSVEFKGERTGVIELRKHFAGYLRGIPGVSRLRAELMQFSEPGAVLDHIEKFVRDFPVLSATPSVAAQAQPV